jgi:hypothetical protein
MHELAPSPQSPPHCTRCAAACRLSCAGCGEARAARGRGESNVHTRANHGANATVSRAVFSHSVRPGGGGGPAGDTAASATRVLTRTGGRAAVTTRTPVSMHTVWITIGFQCTQRGLDATLERRGVCVARAGQGDRPCNLMQSTRRARVGATKSGLDRRRAFAPPRLCKPCGGVFGPTTCASDRMGTAPVPSAVLRP